MLFFFAVAFSLLQCVPLDQIKFLMALARGVGGGDNDFSFLDQYGGTPIINHPQDGEISKFSLWRKDQDLYLIIRGSANTDDWISNFEFIDYEDKEIGCHFHEGFYTTGAEVWNIVGQEIEKQNATGTVYFTGHSRGASVAEVVHVYGRRQMLNLGYKTAGDNFQTVAFAPAPAMSDEGDVLKVTSHFTAFAHNQDIVPILCEGEFFAAAAERCTQSEFKETDFCKSVQNKAGPNTVGSWGNVNSIVGDNLYWLKYDCDFFGDNCNTTTVLAKSKSTSDAIMAWTLDRILAIIDGTAISDHDVSNYSDYIGKITSETFSPNYLNTITSETFSRK